MKVAHKTYSEELAALFFAISIAYYFITPVTGDIFVFFGSAHLAEIQYGGGLWGAIQSWELKPFVNRIFIFVIYKMTRIFVRFEDKQLFILVAKFIYSFFIVVAGYCLTWVVTKRHIIASIMTKKGVFFFLCGILFLHSFRVILQAEYTALLFSFISMYLLLSEHKAKFIVGVFILALIPFLKAVSAIFVVQVLLMLFGFFNWNFKQILKTSIWCATTLFIIILGLYFIYPQEFLDLKDATTFQSSFEFPLSYWTKQFILDCKYQTKLNISHLPFLPISILLLGFIFIKSFVLYLFKKHEFTYVRQAGSLIFAWILGYIAIAVQHKFFVYHFVSLSIPMLFSIVLWIQYAKEYHSLYKNLVICSIAPFLLLFLLNTSQLELLLPEKSTIDGYPPSWNYISMNKQVQIIYKISSAKPLDLNINEKVLYLDGGLGVWSWGTKSFSRYYFPLPLQRCKTNPKLLYMACYKRSIVEINEYNGRYILFNEEWLDISNSVDFEPFKNKLNNNYQRLPILSGWAIYKKI